MTLTDLEILVDFHYWATRHVLAATETLSPEQFTRNLGNSFPSVRDTLAHLYGADWIWCSRWNGESPSGLPDPQMFPDAASLRTAWDAHEPQVRAALKRFGERGVDTPLEYVRNGVRQAQPFAYTLQHVVNHGTYHRGQVVTMLRQLGVTQVPTTDLIAFYRERQGQLSA
jgi:uncharacterized damage-inducible protein DinB